jgi:glycosyltransferase involved in cell wall biosynthesis
MTTTPASSGPRLFVVASREFDLDEMEAAFTRDEGPRHVVSGLRTTHEVVMVTPRNELARRPRRHRLRAALYSSPASWASASAVIRAARSDDVVLFLGEDTAIEFALLTLGRRRRRGPRVMVFVQELDHRVNRWLVRLLHRRFDVLFAPTPDQRRKAEALVGHRRGRPLVDDLVGLDVDFFSPAAPASDPAEARGAADGHRPLIASAGLVHRDYRTLAAAVEGLAVDVEICAAASMPVDAGDTLFPKGGTATLTVEAHSLRGLRDLYRRADLVVVPLTPGAFGGFTVISEAMACGVPVIATASNGGVREMGEEGLILTVPPSDAAALRGAITGLLEDPSRRQALADAGRVFASEQLSNERGARLIASAIAAISPREANPRRPTPV